MHAVKPCHLPTQGHWQKLLDWADVKTAGLPANDAFPLACYTSGGKLCCTDCLISARRHGVPVTAQAALPLTGAVHHVQNQLQVCALEAGGGAQMCNLVMFVAVNALYSGGEAYKFVRSVRWLNLGMWTCWNTVSPWSFCSTAESLSSQLTSLVNSQAKPGLPYRSLHAESSSCCACCAAGETLGGGWLICTVFKPTVLGQAVGRAVHTWSCPIRNVQVC